MIPRIPSGEPGPSGGPAWRRLPIGGRTRWLPADQRRERWWPTWWPTRRSRRSQACPTSGSSPHGSRRSDTPRSRRWPRPGRTPALLALLAPLPWAGCGSPPPPFTDEEKRARVEEMSVEVDERYPGVESVTVKEVGGLLEDGNVVLVDVREAGERAVSWIPGSISAEEFERDPGAWDGRTVVAYCTIGERSSAQAARWSAEGRPVLNLRGSLLAWTHAGGPLVGPDGPTNRLHVYGSTWDLAPSRFETIW